MCNDNPVSCYEIVRMAYFPIITPEVEPAKDQTKSSDNHVMGNAPSPGVLILSRVPFWRAVVHSA